VIEIDIDSSGDEIPALQSDEDHNPENDEDEIVVEIEDSSLDIEASKAETSDADATIEVSISSSVGLDEIRYPEEGEPSPPEDVPHGPQDFSELPAVKDIPEAESFSIEIEEDSQDFDEESKIIESQFNLDNAEEVESLSGYSIISGATDNKAPSTISNFSVI
jgi:hypothetical protein